MLSRGRHTRLVASSTPRFRRQERGFAASARGRRGAELKHKAIESPLENAFASMQMTICMRSRGLKRIHAVDWPARVIRMYACSAFNKGELQRHSGLLTWTPVTVL